MFKKILTLMVLLCFIFNMSVSAAGSFELKVGKEFYTIDEDSHTVAALFGLETDELNSFCAQKDIVFLACNKDKTKEIRLCRFETDFSKGVGDFANYSDNELYTLSLDIIGIEGVTGKIVKNNGISFIKTEMSTENEEKDFSVIQYTTVVEGEYYVLTFYTNHGCDNTYIDEVFASFSCERSIDNLPSEPDSLWFYVIIAAIALTVIVMLALLYFIFLKRRSAE